MELNRECFPSLLSHSKKQKNIIHQNSTLATQIANPTLPSVISRIYIKSGKGEEPSFLLLNMTFRHWDSKLACESAALFLRSWESYICLDSRILTKLPSLYDLTMCSSSLSLSSSLYLLSFPRHNCILRGIKAKRELFYSLSFSIKGSECDAEIQKIPWKDDSYYCYF